MDENVLPSFVDADQHGSSERTECGIGITSVAMVPGSEDGQSDLVVQLQQKLERLEQVYRSAIREREIASALLGKPLIQGAAGQLIRLWADDFDVIEESSRVRVVASDGRGVEQTVKDRLASSDFAHFCLPSSRGGTSARGESRSTQPAPSAPHPRTLGEAAVQQWRSQGGEATATAGVGWGYSR